MIFKSFSPAGKATVGLLFAVSGYLLDPLVRSIHGRSRFLTVVLVAIGGLSLLIGITELTIGRPIESLEEGWANTPRFLQWALTIVMSIALFAGIAWLISILR